MRNGCVTLKKRLFIKNALILTATSIILRAAGIFLRIYVSNTIGDEGMGLHQLIFSIYTFASAIASSGINIAVTRLVTEDVVTGGKQAVNKILFRSLLLSLLLGLCAYALLFFCADFVSQKWLCDTRVALSLKILSFGLPFMAVSSCLKGYFMARRKASTPSNSQLFEQLVRIFVVLLCLSRVEHDNLEKACAAVVLGNALSELGACVYIFVGYLRDNRLVKGGTAPTHHIMRRLVYIFVPVAFSSYLNTILHTIENVMVPDALTRYNHSREMSLSQFGALKGMALPLLFFPASFLGALSALLIPEITEYSASKQNKALKNVISYTLLITSLSSVFIGAFFSMYAYEIGALVYKSNDVGLYILSLAPIIPFMYTESIIAGILSGLNQQVAALRYNVYNSAIRIVLITIFLPQFGIYAFLAIMILSNLFTSCLNIKQLLTVTNMRLDIASIVAKPLCAIVPAMFCAYAIKGILYSFGTALSLLMGLLVMGVIYTSFILLLKCITKNDIALLAKYLKR